MKNVPSKLTSSFYEKKKPCNPPLPPYLQTKITGTSIVRKTEKSKEERTRDSCINGLLL
jgi:hypothetical protein